jgi:hypothetical protein
LIEDCNLKEEGRGKKEDGEKKDSSGAQEGRRILKKVGDNCTVSPELGKARAYLDVLKWNHLPI